MRYLLAANAKDEHNIEEWVHYHLLLGFTAILLWDDNSKEPIADRVNDDRVIIISNHDDKTGYMRRSIEYAMEKGYDWIIHLDADEYLYLGKNVRLGEGFILPSHAICVLFPWVMFGSNNIDKLEPKGSCLEPFVMCAHKTHHCVKSFARVDAIENVRSPHEYTYKQVQTHQNTFFAPDRPLHRFSAFQPKQVRNVDGDQCFIAHYRWQSWDIFCHRKGRIRDDTQKNWKFKFCLDVENTPEFFHRKSNQMSFYHLVNNYKSWILNEGLM